MARKKFTDVDVLTATRERFALLFERFDRVVVSFSGGKDSTVCLNLALEAAHAAGKLPLEAHFWDEEAIHPQTIEYVERVRARPDVKLHWLCVPITHRNACSRQELYWKPWDPEKRALWCRPLPEGAISTFDGFEDGMTMPDAAPFVFSPEGGTVADIRGLRADESIRRLQAMTARMKENWIGGPRRGFNSPISPIYDWTTVDVWTAPRLFGWDYNRTYDLFNMAGVPLSLQRVCPPFGEEPLANLPLYAVCWPELWEKMLARVHGARTAGRYAKTELYAYGGQSKPKGMTWREWAFRTLDLYPRHYRNIITANIQRVMEMHQGKTNRPIHDTDSDPLTGLSWKFLAMVVTRGDLKGRKVQMLNNRAIVERNKQGLEMHEVMDDVDGTRY
jgi:predicted phosphoadenosine phosphosulfate sulfurtransferase